MSVTYTTDSTISFSILLSGAEAALSAVLKVFIISQRVIVSISFADRIMKRPVLLVVIVVMTNEVHNQNQKGGSFPESVTEPARLVIG
jgi:hypothetical protein